MKGALIICGGVLWAMAIWFGQVTVSDIQLILVLVCAIGGLMCFALAAAPTELEKMPAKPPVFEPLAGAESWRRRPQGGASDGENRKG